MNEQEIKMQWQQISQQWDENLIISKSNELDIKHMKIVHLITSMRPLKLFTLLVGVLWVGFGFVILSNLIIHDFSGTSKFFLFSALGQLILTAIAIAIYVFQLVRISQVDITDPIVKTQQTIAELKSSTLWSVRILFLQLPLWTTFWWTEHILQTWQVWQWVVVVNITLLFIIAAAWIFLNVKAENKGKPWFKFLFSGNEWIPLMKSLEILEESGEFTEK